MKKITFDKIPNCTGRLVSSVELVLSHPKPEKLKKILSAKNKGAAFRLKKAKESAVFYKNQLAGLQYLETPTTDAAYINVVDKLENLEKVISDLQSELTLRFYIENPDGTLSVPAGFWYLCEKVNDDAHLNKTIKPYFLPGLRPYQTECLTELFKYKRAVIELMTGGGKSKIIFSAALAAVKAKKRVMIVVPTEYLVGQMYKEIKELHPNSTACGGEYKHPKLGWDIMVTTINSAKKYIDIPNVLLLDESHHAPASTWTDLLSESEATHVYCFTATAFRSDGLDIAIHAFGGPVVFSRDARWGIDNGWLSPIQIVQIRIHPKYPHGAKISLHDNIPAPRAYRTVMSAENVKLLIQQRLNAALSKGRRTMVVFKTVKFAEVFKKFCSGNPHFQVAHANKQKSKNPKYPLQQFNKNETNLLVACDKLISEGIDIPDSNCLIIATQHSSEIITYQTVGRVLRKHPNKKDAVIIDIAVMGYSQFERAAKKRLEIYKYLCDNVMEIDV